MHRSGDAEKVLQPFVAVDTAFSPPLRARLALLSGVARCNQARARACTRGEGGGIALRAVCRALQDAFEEGLAKVQASWALLHPDVPLQSECATPAAEPLGHSGGDSHGAPAARRPRAVHAPAARGRVALAGWLAQGRPLGALSHGPGAASAPPLGWLSIPHVPMIWRSC